MLYFPLSALINLLTALSASIIILINQPKLINYFLFHVSIFFWSFFYFLWQITTNYSHALIYCRLLTIGSIFLAYFFFEAIAQFIKGTPQNLKPTHLINFFFAVTFTILTFTPLMVKTVEKTYSFTFWPKAGILYFLIILYFTLLLLISEIMLIQAYKKNPTIFNKLIFISIGILFAFFGGFTNFFLWYNIKIYPIGNILVSVYVFFIAYAILKHELMDIRLAITRTLAYIISSIIFVLSISITYLVLLPYTPFELFGVMMIAGFWAFSFIPFTEFLITSVKRKFVKGYYEPAKVLLTVSEMLLSKTNREEILHSVFYPYFLHDKKVSKNLECSSLCVTFG